MTSVSINLSYRITLELLMQDQQIFPVNVVTMTRLIDDLAYRLKPFNA
ncbi:MAG: hypothetical protein WAX63_15390 [Rhodoferax sp.]